jgi:4-amino-4-deoxy-L-arabinose transferase-like glycosyltransferase
MLCTFLYFYYLYKTGGGLARSLPLALLAGLATLAKGPVGAALPGLTALVFLWRRRELAFVKRLYLPVTIPAGLAVAATWYLLALQQGGERFFLRQIVHEIIGTPLGGAGHNHNVFYYIPALILGMAPWSLFFPALAIFLWRQRRRLAETELLYPLIWFATLFVVISLALGKRTVYILPLYPAAALLCGAWWAKLSAGELSSASAKGAAIAAAALVALVGAALLAEALGWSPLGFVRSFLRPRDREGLALVADAMDRHRVAILLYAALSAAAAVPLVRAGRRNAWPHALAALGAVMTCFFWLAQNVFHPELAAPYDFKPFSARVGGKVPPDAPLLFYGGTNKAPAFYVRLYAPGFRQKTAGIKPPFYLLVAEKQWKAMRGKEGLSEVDASEAIGIDSRQRLVLVKVDETARIRLPEPVQPSDEDEE